LFSHIAFAQEARFAECLDILWRLRHTAGAMKSKKSLIVLAVVGLWYVAVVLLSAFRPPHDTLAVGIDSTTTKRLGVTVTFSCNSVFSSAPVETPLPPLKQMPAGQTPLAYTRDPCVDAHHDARKIFAFDTVVLVLVGAGVVGWNLRLKRNGTETTASLASPG